MYFNAICEKTLGCPCSGSPSEGSAAVVMRKPASVRPSKVIAFFQVTVALTPSAPFRFLSRPRSGGQAPQPGSAPRAERARRLRRFDPDAGVHDGGAALMDQDGIAVEFGNFRQILGHGAQAHQRVLERGRIVWP